MHALVVTNMYPSSARPALGSFVRDQVRALQRIDDLDVELYAFVPGGTRSYARAARDLRRRFGGRRFDIVHSHFGLTAWPSLAVNARHRLVTLHGNDLYHPRSRPVTKAVLGRMDLIGTPTCEFAAKVPGAGVRRDVAILPCGIDVERFRPIDRRAARERLGLGLDGRYVLFPYDPARASKRFDRARQLVGDDGAAADARGDRAGGGPDLGQRRQRRRLPIGLGDVRARLRRGARVRRAGARATDRCAPRSLAGIAGTYCAEWELESWRAALAPHLEDSDPRIAGRARALEYSAEALAARVASAWRWLCEGGPPPPLYSPAQALAVSSPGASSS